MQHQEHPNAELVSREEQPPQSHAAGMPPGATFEGRPLEVSVDDRGVERAIRTLKRKVATEGVLKSLKLRRSYEKPSIRKRRKRREAERRRLRAARRIARGVER